LYVLEVVSFKRDEYDSAESLVDLDFVDFGDWEEKKITEVFQIRTDFLRLKLQAVRCSLAHVRYQYLHDVKSWILIEQYKYR